MAAGGTTDSHEPAGSPADRSARENLDPSAAMHARDRAAVLLGYDVVAGTGGHAVVRMVVRDDMLNGLDVCHGGIIFTLADSAMAHASNGHGEQAFAVAASIDFLSPGRPGATLTAEAVEQFRRGRTALYEVVVTADDETVVARFHGRTLSDAAAETPGGAGVPNRDPTSGRRDRRSRSLP